MLKDVAESKMSKIAKSSFKVNHGFERCDLSVFLQGKSLYRK